MHQPGVSLLVLAPAGSVSGYFGVEISVIGRYAELFSEFGARNQEFNSLNRPWRDVYLGIGNGDLGFEFSKRGTAPSLSYLHFVAVDPAAVGIGLAEPAPVLVTVGLNNESVTFPMSDIPAHPFRKSWFVGEFPAIHVDGAEGVV